jgi:putative transposase
MSDYRRYFVKGGTYFFTVVTYHRHPFFRSDLARDLLRQTWLATQTELPFTNIASVLLHDHFHCLWTLPPSDKNFSDRLQKIKCDFTSAWLAHGGYEVAVSRSQKARGNRGVWQRRFWEHVIRDEQDLENHFDYIHFNPVKHRYVERPFDWPWSTFHRYVALGHYSSDWGRQCPEHIRDQEWE